MSHMFFIKVNSANDLSDIKSILDEAKAAGLGEPTIKSLLLAARDRQKYLDFRKATNGKFMRRHKSNGATQCQAQIGRVQEYDRLDLVRDPMGEVVGVPHGDPNAIAIYHGDERVGYVSAKAAEFGGFDGGLAKWLSGRLDKGEPWSCYVYRIVGEGKASLGLRLMFVQEQGESVDDWPDGVDIEAPSDEQSIAMVVIDTLSMDKKLSKVFIHRELLAESIRKEFSKIRSFRIKYGTYSESHIEWLDRQHDNIEKMLMIN